MRQPKGETSLTTFVAENTVEKQMTQAKDQHQSPPPQAGGRYQASELSEEVAISASSLIVANLLLELKD
jgi:hypothetical protein